MIVKFSFKGQSFLLLFILFNLYTQASEHVPRPVDKPYKKEVKAGVAQMDITPPVGIRLAGYFSERVSTGIHDSLWAKAIVLQQGKEKFAFLFCDLAGLDRSFTKVVREQIGNSRHLMLKIFNSELPFKLSLITKLST